VSARRDLDDNRYAAMHKNGGGIHCSTTPLRRDKV